MKLTLSRRQGAHNFLQVLLLILTLLALGTPLVAVGEGLLGNPEMFITCNGSSHTVLRWYQARGKPLLPRPGCVTVSGWWSRFLMLGWALWLSASLLRWLRWAWEKSFRRGGIFRRANPAVKSAVAPPPLPTMF